MMTIKFAKHVDCGQTFMHYPSCARYGGDGSCCGNRIDGKDIPVTIFKIQRPILSDGSLRNILIYDEDRKFQNQHTVSAEDIVEIFPDGSYKVFVDAELIPEPDEQGYGLQINHFIPEAEWPEW